MIESVSQTEHFVAETSFSIVHASHDQFVTGGGCSSEASAGEIEFGTIDALPQNDTCTGRLIKGNSDI
ncbi:uncharacterized protein PHALS_13490 [Plasmopara halstedii]|uniref:Uncharacterized protein n=1 Tax=Plasmopara halstedii TaxID=4781 RepID=A0A0P1AQY3_PLAHL|nr:uncharacterized protein PHALS_13490 [Plasmopara halstedii]CEG43286.1 hypothetical protein PHALS_13490 [Plasmopara halstedii]|eukprot:XP_024579655.1 hypothetical protein PHALS_13490 [Plasmopara halstedii]